MNLCKAFVDCRADIARSELIYHILSILARISNTPPHSRSHAPSQPHLPHPPRHYVIPSTQTRCNVAFSNRRHSLTNQDYSSSSNQRLHIYLHHSTSTTTSHHVFITNTPNYNSFKKSLHTKHNQQDASRNPRSAEQGWR